MTDTVVAIIAARNAHRTIAAAVRSALGEPEVAEVVVVDDASSDDTAAEAERADDRSGRLKVIRLTTNAGPSKARNIGIAESTSPIVSVLDADDVFLQGRMRRLLSVEADWDFLADDLIISPPVADPRDLATMLATATPQPVFIDLATFVRENFAGQEGTRSELGYLKPLMKRAFLNARDLRYVEAMRLGEDFALYASALHAGARFALVPACGYVAIVHSDSLSHQHRTQDLAAFRAFDDALLRADLPKAARTALEGHRESLNKRTTYRMALDAKREGRLLETARHCLASPSIFAYIAAETWKAYARTPRPAAVLARPLVGADRLASL